jgi:hypothetical protein
MPAKEKAKTHPTEYFVAGGIAGVVSRTAIAPIERVKILFQIAKGSAAAQMSGMSLARDIWHKEGAFAFWKGNSAAVVRVMPYMSFTFLTFEEYRARLLAAGVPKQAATLAAGSLGGVTAVVLTYPLDLVRATMATPGSTHTSMGAALVSIYRERGPRALYSGVTATCIGVAPYAGCAPRPPPHPHPFSHARPERRNPAYRCPARPAARPQPQVSEL